MKNFTRTLCLMLSLVCLLCACQTGNPTTGTTTAPTTTTPAPGIDFFRALPVLPEKYVTSTPGDGDLVLALDGTANATIVIPKDHAKARVAAEDLSNYLTKITGATFVTVTDDQALPEGNLILVGPTKKTLELGIGPFTGYPDAEKLTVTRKDNCLILYGNDDVSYTGTFNAVTFFLEEAGCGWFDDSELWQIVPDCPTLAVKEVSKTYEPTIDSRYMTDISALMAARWYCGGDDFSAGHGLFHFATQKDYAEHPEWFAEVNGSRDPTPVRWWQFCYTNQSFADQVAAGVIEYFDNHPNHESFSIASNDGWYEGWCECEVCATAGNQSDQMLVFANRVAEKVAQKHPDKRVSILGYHATFLPPTKTKAHPNVEVMFCLETNPLDDLIADRQIHSGYNSINKLVYTQSWLDNVTQWIQDSDLKYTAIWSWFCIDSYWGDIPWVQGVVANRNIDVFESLGVNTVFIDCTKNVNDLRWPLYYTFAKCMYFGDMNGEEILYDACKKLYGAAADEMFLFYRLLADCAQQSASPSGVNWVAPSLMDVYGSQVTLGRNAVQAVRAKLDLLTPEQKERVENQLRGWVLIDIKI